MINPAFPAYKYVGGSSKNIISKPGELPVPEGMSRRFHYTKTDDLDALRNEGLRVDKSVSHLYGDPKGVWSSPNFPNWYKPVVEFWEDPTNIISDTYQFKDVKPHQIMTIHEPWHEIYRYAKEHFTLDEAIRRIQKLMPMKDERYVKTLEQLLKEKSLL